MRFFILLFTCLIAVLPADAKQQLTPALQRKIAARTLRAADQTPEKQDKTPSRKQALEALAERQNPDNWKLISWSEFLKHNKNAKGVELVSTHLGIKCTDRLCALAPEPIPENAFMTTGNSEVNYKEFVANHKRIYVGEGMNHDTKAAPLEMAKILRAVRAVNPNARILLAAEFLIWSNLDNLPLYYEYEKKINQYIQEGQQYLDKAKQYKNKVSVQEYQNYTNELTQGIQELQKQKADLFQIKENLQKNPLLKRAKAPSELETSKEYEIVFKTADELGIDQLALDDYVAGVKSTNEIGVKIGEYVVWAGQQDKIPSWGALNEQNASNEQSRTTALLQTISVSPWGRRERNREWARRIKTLQPFYDVIIVYAGDGHLNVTYYIDLQPMMGEKDFLNIMLYPTEQLPAEKEQQYTERNNALEMNKITQEGKIWEEKEQSVTNANLFIAGREQIVWKDRSKPLWVIVEAAANKIDQATRNWNKEQKAAWLQEAKFQEENFPFQPEILLDVYLPAK